MKKLIRVPAECIPILSQMLLHVVAAVVVVVVVVW